MWVDTDAQGLVSRLLVAVVKMSWRGTGEGERGLVKIGRADEWWMARRVEKRA